MKVSEESLRYPIGRFVEPRPNGPIDLAAAISTLAELPGLLRQATENLAPNHLDVPYRDGGWTVRQVVHHVADSHMNAFIRVRLALTKEWPTIKPYNEAAWAELNDSQAPIGWSLALIENLHARWVMLLQSLDRQQWKRGFVHPESGFSTVELATLLYAWHSKHHLAHITRLRLRKHW